MRQFPTEKKNIFISMPMFCQEYQLIKQRIAVCINKRNINEAISMTTCMYKNGLFILILLS